jgi:hypothetical protein
LAALSFFGFASIVHILPPIAGMKPFGDWIYDTEWWDLYASPLPDVWAPLPVAAGKKLILLPGNLSSLKGTEFILTAARRAAELNLPFQFGLVGRPHDLPSNTEAQLESAGGFFRVCEPSDVEFLAYIKRADLLWCCYHPQYDQSSGIFGRALQLDLPAIVRSGSLLANYLERYGRGIVIRYGEVDELLDILRTDRMTTHGTCNIAAFYAHSRARLRTLCGLA